MSFTFATKPHTRRRTSTRRFLAITDSRAVDVDGVTIVGAGGNWHIDATPYRVVFDDGPYWWLFGGDVSPAVEVVDPHDAIAVLRRRNLLPGRCA